MKEKVEQLAVRNVRDPRHLARELCDQCRDAEASIACGVEGCARFAGLVCCPKFRDKVA